MSGTAPFAGNPGPRDDSRLCVWLVEDHPIVRRLLRATLPAAEYEVLEFGSARETIESIDAVTGADVVLLDWHLGDGDGLDILKLIRRRSALVSVIVVTGDIAERERAVALEHGADLFLTKPFSPVQLLDAIDGICHRTTPSSTGGWR